MNSDERVLLLELLKLSFREIINPAYGNIPAQKAANMVLAKIFMQYHTQVEESLYEPWRDKLAEFAQLHFSPNLQEEFTIALGEDVETHGEVTVSNDDLSRGMAVFGTTGSGKSVLIINLFLQLISLGLGGLFIDPDGESIKELLPRIPSNLLDKVISLDLADKGRFIGLNPLSSMTQNGHETLLMPIMKRLFKITPETPRMENTLRALIRTCWHCELTIDAIPSLLRDKIFRESCVKRIPDDSLDAQWLHTFWKEEFESLNRTLQSERSETILNKIYHMLMLEPVVYSISQEVNTLDFRKVMDERKIVLLNLNVSKIEEDAVRFLAIFLLSSFKDALFSRANMDSSLRSLFPLVADEWQLYLTPDFKDILTRGRKYGFGVITATQTMSALTEAGLVEVTQQLGNHVTFRVTPQDAHALAPMYAREIAGEKKKIVIPWFTDYLLGGNHAHEDELVNKFVALWREQFRLSRESKGNETIGGGTGAKYNSRMGYKTTFRDARANPHFHQVGTAREEIEKLNDYAHQVMTSNPYMVFPLSLLFHMIDAFEDPCFDRKAYEDWRRDISKYPPCDYCTFLYELMSEDGSDIIYGSVFNNTQRVKTRPNAYSLEEFEQVYNRFFTATNEQEFARASVDYEKLVRRILTLDLQYYFNLSGLYFTVSFADYNPARQYELLIRAAWKDEAEKILSLLPLEKLTFKVKKENTYDLWSCETYPAKLLTPLIQEKVDQIIATGKESFEAIIRLVRSVAQSLSRLPIYDKGAIVEEGETVKRTAADLVKEMEVTLSRLDYATAMVFIGSKGKEVKPCIRTYPLAPVELDAPGRLLREVQARENAQEYTTDRAEVEKKRNKQSSVPKVEPSKATPVMPTTSNPTSIVFDDNYPLLLFHWHFLSLDNIIRLLGKKPTDRNHIRERLKKLVVAGWLAETDWKEKGKAGKAKKIYSLAEDGLKHVEAEYELKSGSRKMGLTEHTLIVSNALVQFASLPRFVPEITLVGFTHERTFKAKAIKLDQGGLEPDGLVRYTLAHPYGNGQLNLYYENDRGFEGKDVWQNKLGKYILALEKGLLGQDRIAIAVCHSGGSIVEWTEEALSNHKEYAPLVYLTDVDPLTFTPLEFCTNAIWRKPLSTDLAPLLQTSPDRA